jgi:hypothetical protein
MEDDSDYDVENDGKQENLIFDDDENIFSYKKYNEDE